MTRLFVSHKNDKTGLYNKNDTGDNLYDCHCHHKKEKT